MTQEQQTQRRPAAVGTPLVGVFGPGRNGSTLLMRLLDASPGLWVCPVELNYFRNVAPATLRGKAAAVARAAGLLERRSAALTFRRWAETQLRDLEATYLSAIDPPVPPNPDVAARIALEASASVAENFVLFMDAIRRAYDPRPAAERTLVFKSIEVADLARYGALFPTLRFVHIVRDPGSNYASLKRSDMVTKRKPFWSQGDLLRTQLETRWIPHARFILTGLRAEPSRHFLVRYEELCADPATVVGEMCRWLGVDAPEDPTQQTVLGGQRMKALPGNPSKAGLDTPQRVVANMADRYDYDEVVTERERRFIRLRTSTLMRELGYEDVEPPPALAERLGMIGAWTLPDKWELMNVDSRVRLTRAFLARRYYIWSRLL